MSVIDNSKVCNLSSQILFLANRAFCFTWFHSVTVYSLLLKRHNSNPFRYPNTELSSVVLYVDLEPLLFRQLRQK